jgi:uncharacterized membrane protein
MAPAIGMATLWLLFGGTHIGLATARIRARLVERLGEWGFVLAYSAVAAACFALLVSYYAAHRFEGAPGPGLGALPACRVALVAVVVAGVVLATASLVVYPRSPMALFNETVREPYGLERITRHSFFVGVALLGAAHALLATHLVGTVFAGGLALLAAAGAWHQDRKLLRLRGEPYAAYLAATSAFPLTAILAGRQRLVWREMPVVSLAAGLVVAFLLRRVHGALLDHGGAWVIGGALGGAAVATVQAWRQRNRRIASRRPRVLAAPQDSLHPRDAHGGRAWQRRRRTFAR